MTAVMDEGERAPSHRGVAARVGGILAAAATAVAWAVGVAAPVMARVEPPVTQGAPGEASQVALWLWILLALVVVGVIGAVAWARSMRGRTVRPDVYALVRRAIEAGPGA
jgi:hypothetical protein